MRHLFAGAVALSLLFAGAASAQDQPRPDQQSGYQQDQRSGYSRDQQYRDNHDRGGNQMGDRRERIDGGDGGHRACHWRHHHRVCRWRR